MTGNGKAVEDADGHVYTDTIEDSTHTINCKRKKGNPWRDSGYITSDEDDSSFEQFDDKKQERIPSIFVF